MFRFVHTLFEKTKRYQRACTVGLSSLLLQLLIFNVLRHVLSPVIANLIAIELAIINNFILNNMYTFKDRQLTLKLNGHLCRHLITFNLYSLGSLGIQTLVVFLGTHGVKATVWIENGLVFLGIVLGSIINYMIYSRLVWPRQRS